MTKKVTCGWWFTGSEAPVPSLLSWQERLALFQGGDSSPIYLLHGSESRVYLSAASPGVLLKVWKDKRKTDAELNTAYLIALSQRFRGIPEFDAFFRVSRVYEMGDGWITREYFSNVEPLVHAIQHDEEALRVFNLLRLFLLAERDKGDDAVDRLSRRFHKHRSTDGTLTPSENLLWSHELRKIVMGDAF